MPSCVFTLLWARCFLSRRTASGTFSHKVADLESIAEQKVVGGLFGSDIKGFGVWPGVSREAGGGFDAPGSADGEEERRFIEGGENAIELERSFAKPADVRADFATAGARGKFARGFVELYVV